MSGLGLVSLGFTIFLAAPEEGVVLDLLPRKSIEEELEEEEERVKEDECDEDLDFAAGTLAQAVISHARHESGGSALAIAMEVAIELQSRRPRDQPKGRNGRQQRRRHVRRVREEAEDKQDARNSSRKAPLDAARRRYYWRRKWRLAAARALRMRRKAKAKAKAKAHATDASRKAEAREQKGETEGRRRFGPTRRRAPWKPALQRARAKLRVPRFLGFVFGSRTRGAGGAAAAVAPRQQPPTFRGLRRGGNSRAAAAAAVAAAKSSPSTSPSPSPSPSPSESPVPREKQQQRHQHQPRSPAPTEKEHRAQEELVRIMLASGGSCYNTFSSSADVDPLVEIPLGLVNELANPSGMRKRSRANTAASDLCNV